MRSDLRMDARGSPCAAGVLMERFMPNLAAGVTGAPFSGIARFML